MKKKLLIAAVGAALCAGPVVAAHAAGATLYGHVHMSLDRFDSDGTYIPSYLGESSERGFLSSNSVRFGIKGDEDLGGGLKAIYQIESPALNADTGGGGMGGTLRNTFVGFSGGFGTVKLGRHDTPFKDIGRKLDNFNEQVGDARNILGAGLGYYSGYTAFNWDQRGSNSLRYESPNFSGFMVNYMYATGEGSGLGGSSPLFFDTSHLNSLSATWSAGPMWVGFGYEQHKLDGANDDEKGMRLAGSYTMNDLTLGLIYETLDKLEGYSDLERTTWGVMAAMKMGNNKFKFHWYDADDIFDGFDSGGSLWAIGVDHIFSKTAMVYVNYASADNGDDVAIFNTASGNGGHGNSTPVGDFGASPKAYSVGVILKF